MDGGIWNDYRHEKGDQNWKRGNKDEMKRGFKGAFDSGGEAEEERERMMGKWLDSE